MPPASYKALPMDSTGQIGRQEQERSLFPRIMKVSRAAAVTAAGNLNQRNAGSWSVLDGPGAVAAATATAMPH